MRAPELPEDVVWLGATRPLSLRGELRGRVVLLCCFSASSIHGWHALQVLDALALRLADRPVVLLALLSPRLPSEADPDQAARLVAQLGIRHPVALDPTLAAWRSYGCVASPTFVLIDAAGEVRFRGAGEPDASRLLAAIEALLQQGFTDGLLRAGGLESLRDDREEPESALRFPAGLAFDRLRGWLWIADTGRHRLLAVDPDRGVLQMQVGSGLPGSGDGTLAEASFVAPRGLAMLDGILFVADAAGHAIRRVDPAAGVVTTVCGDGRATADLAGGRSGTAQQLCWPLALAACGPELWVAIGGTHQLWRVDPASGLAVAGCGSGGLGRRDGDAGLATLAQPCGIAAVGRRLWFTDAEGGALRWFDLDTGTVGTRLDDTALQWPRGVAAGDGGLFVADCWHRSVLAVGESSAAPVLGAEQGLVAPEALALAGRRLFVADTGAHRILRHDLDRGGTDELVLRGLDPPVAPAPIAVELARSADLELRLHLARPAGARLAHGYLPRVRLENPDGRLLAIPFEATADVEGGLAVLRGVPCDDAGEGLLRVTVEYATCHDPGLVPHRQRRRAAAAITRSAGGARRLEL